MKTPGYSSDELDVIRLISFNGGSILSSRIESKNYRDSFGAIQSPGIRLIKSLEKKDLIFETTEDPIELDSGETFTFTTDYYLTDLGQELARSIY